MQTHPYSCLTCSLAFTSSTAQRQHYSSDLHRYNAKRKVADLPPVTAEIFNEKIQERREKLAGVTPSSSSSAALGQGAGAFAAAASSKLECKACGKTFGSSNVYDDHLKSRKHREKVMKGVASIKVGSSSSGSGEENAMKEDTKMDAPAAAAAKDTMPEYQPTCCLFCPRSFSTLEINLKHMSNNHAFYIPDLTYCINVPGLLQQMGEDVLLGNICIFCSHGFGGLVTGSESDAELVKRAKRGTEAVRKHMVDKNHCRIPWDSEEQRLTYSDFYDYSSSYPEGYDGRNSDGEMEVQEEDVEEWEDDGDDSEINEDDQVVMDYSAIKGRKNMRKANLEDGMGYRLAVGEQDFELVLPSGTRIGHRALKGIYKQNVMPYIDLDEPKDKLSRLILNTQARAERKQLNSSALVKRGGDDSNNLPMVVARNRGEAKNARKVDNAHFANKKMQRQLQITGKVGNNQKHFRDHLLQ